MKEYKINFLLSLTDIDECAPEPSVCGPDSICTNTIGGYNCSCVGGFTETNSSLMISVNNTCRGKYLKMNVMSYSSLFHCQ